MSSLFYLCLGFLLAYATSLFVERPWSMVLVAGVLCLLAVRKRLYSLIRARFYRQGRAKQQAV